MPKTEEQCKKMREDMREKIAEVVQVETFQKRPEASKIDVYKKNDMGVQ